MPAQLHEKYRPQCWAELVGHDKARKAVDTLRAHGGLAGRAYWISGASGTGKTTMAYLIAAEIADAAFVYELDASRLTPARLEQIERHQPQRGLWGTGGRVYIVNEAHGLKSTTVRQLLVMLERLPPHVAWIFTSTKEISYAKQKSLFGRKEDDKPLLSWCSQLTLQRRGLNALFAVRAQEIARKEHLDGKPMAAYGKLLNDRRQNLRDVLEVIGTGAMLKNGRA